MRRRLRLAGGGTTIRTHPTAPDTTTPPVAVRHTASGRTNYPRDPQGVILGLQRFRLCMTRAIGSWSCPSLANVIAIRPDCCACCRSETQGHDPRARTPHDAIKVSGTVSGPASGADGPGHWPGAVCRSFANGCRRVDRTKIQNGCRHTSSSRNNGASCPGAGGAASSFGCRAKSGKNLAL